MVVSPSVGSGWDTSMAEGLSLLDTAAVVPRDNYGLNQVEDRDVQTRLERRLPGSTILLADAAKTTPPPQRHVRRQSIVVSTDVDLIVENEDGSTVAEATLHGLPTAPIEVPLPIGTLSLPALVNTPALISLPVADLNTKSLPSASSLAPSQSLSIQIPDSSSQIVLSSPPTPAPSDSTPTSLSTPLSTPFPSIATFNSTTTTSSLLPSNSVSSQTKNSTTSAFLSTSQSTLLTSTSSRSISSTLTSSSASPTTSSGIIGGFGSGGTSVTSAAPSATSTSAAATASQSTPTYVPVVGGVLGGLAGLALLLVGALFFLRWYKRRHRPPGQLPNDDENVPPGTSHSGAPMAHNSAAPWGAAIAPFIRRMRPHSTATAATTDTGTSERGFQKISGRKIESVLVSGGDGYGGRGPGGGNLSGQSFYRDSSGTYGGGASQNSSMVVGPASPRKSVANSDFTDMSGIAGPSNAGRVPDKEVVTMRPGPARQAVASPAYTLGPQFSGSEAAQPSSDRGYSPGPTHAIRPPDPLGRSRPSHDGSRGSKFAEDMK